MVQPGYYLVKGLTSFSAIVWLLNTPPSNPLYLKAELISDKFSFFIDLICKFLGQYGIHAKLML
jgi:hypothetical protein